MTLNKSLQSKIEILEKSINQIQKKERDFCVVPRTAEQLKNYKNLVHSNFENEITCSPRRKTTRCISSRSQFIQI